MALIESDAALRDLLERTRTIAVLGIKDGEADDAYRVPCYMRIAGHRILPVNPKLESVLGKWPFGGIQTDETMLSILGRFAARRRGGEA